MKKNAIDPKSELLLLIALARLRSQGWNQTEIGEQLGVSQSEVSRLLNEAVAQRLLSRAPALLRRNISDADFRAAEQAHLSRGNLAQVLEPLVPEGVPFEVRVAPGDQNTFAYSAASWVVDLIRQSKQMGIMWGRSIYELVRGILVLWDAVDSGEAGKVRCIPLCGDPLFVMNDRRVKFSASYVAAMLEEALDEPELDGLPCLSGVPAYISRQRARESGSTVEAWRRFVQGIPGYQLIFGEGEDSTKALIRQVDTIITGVGTIVLKKEAPWRETGDFIVERLIQDSLTKEELNQLIYGDIGGILIPRQKLSSAQKKQVEELNVGWMGLKLEHLQKLTRRAGSDKGAGVIVVAYGFWRAEMVKAILRLGLVNQLIVDRTLSEALTEDLAPKPA